MKMENREPEKAAIPDEALDLVSGGVGGHPNHSQVDSKKSINNNYTRRKLQ